MEQRVAEEIIRKAKAGFYSPGYMGGPVYMNGNPAHPACMTQGCMANKITEMERQANELLQKARLKVTGQALWCDIGDHSFSDKAKPIERWSYETTDENGEAIEETMLACPQHGRRATFQAQAKKAAQQTHIAELENELGIGKDQGIA